jgi:hypothetical protein
MRDQTRTFVRGISPRDALIREAKGTDLPGRVCTDLDSLAGSWVDVPGFDEAIEAQGRVDEALAVRIAIDTNRYVDVAKGLPRLWSCSRRADEIFVRFVVLGELRAGFAGGAQARGTRPTSSAVSTAAVSTWCLPMRSLRITTGGCSTSCGTRAFLFPRTTSDCALVVVQHQVYLFARDPDLDHLPQIPRLRRSQR